MLCLAVLLSAGLKLTFGLHSFMDVDFRDETYYLTNGVELLSRGMPRPESAPLYAIWYFLLSLVQHDPLKLYFFNYRIITVLIPLLLFVLLRRLSSSRPAALIASAYFLISFANLASYPKSAHFAFVIVLTAFIISTYFSSLRLSTLCLATGVLLASYVRPELFLAYLLLVFLYLWAVVREARPFRILREAPAIVILVAAPALLIASLGSPVLGGEHRSFLAFRQFFSINWVRWAASDLDPWSHYGPIASQQFGPVESVWQAFAARPWLFLKHVVYNLAGTPVSLGKSLFLHYNIIMPLTSKTYWVAEAGALLAAAAVYVLHFLRRYRRTLRSFVSKERRLLLHAAICCAPGLLSSTLFLPKRYFVLVTAVFALVLVTLWLFRDMGRSWGAGRLALAGAAIIALTPCICTLGNSTRMAFGGNLVNARTIEFIRSLEIDREVTLLTEDGHHHIYCGDQYSSVRGTKKDCRFSKFMKDQGINMILITRSLTAIESFRQDAEWEAFRENPGAFGFEEMAVPGTPRRLLVKREVLVSR